MAIISKGFRREIKATVTGLALAGVMHFGGYKENLGQRAYHFYDGGLEAKSLEVDNSRLYDANKIKNLMVAYKNDVIAQRDGEFCKLQEKYDARFEKLERENAELKARYISQTPAQTPVVINVPTVPDYEPQSRPLVGMNSSNSLDLALDILESSNPNKAKALRHELKGKGKIANSRLRTLEKETGISGLYDDDKGPRKTAGPTTNYGPKRPASDREETVAQEESLIEFINRDLGTYRNAAVKDGSRSSWENAKKMVESGREALADHWAGFTLCINSDRYKNTSVTADDLHPVIALKKSWTYGLADLGEHRLRGPWDSKEWNEVYKGRDPFSGLGIWASRIIWGLAHNTIYEAANGVAGGMLNNFVDPNAKGISEDVDTLKQGAELGANLPRLVLPKDCEKLQCGYDWLAVVPFYFGDHVVTGMGIRHCENPWEAVFEEGYIGPIVENWLNLGGIALGINNWVNPGGSSVIPGSGVKGTVPGGSLNGGAGSIGGSLVPGGFNGS